MVLNLRQAAWSRRPSLDLLLGNVLPRLANHKPPAMPAADQPNAQQPLSGVLRSSQCPTLGRAVAWPPGEQRKPFCRWLLGHWATAWILSLVIFSGATSIVIAAEPREEANLRSQARQLQTQGNWRDALVIFRKLIAEPTTTVSKLPEDLSGGLECLQRLGLTEEADALLSLAIETHPNHGPLWHQAAMELATLPHYGIVSGNRFRRAPQNHDSGAWIEVSEADRLQALRWMAMAEDKLLTQPGAIPARDFYRDLVHLLSQQRSGRQAWLLQHRTDLLQTPNYTDSEADKHLHSLRYAPVDTAGQPILYRPARDWKEASNDGERLRWALDQWKAAEPVEAGLHWIDFLRSQFGVATLAEDRWFLQFQAKVAASSANPEPTPQETTGIYALHTLADHETIAHLANGVRRFPLADEFNPVSLLRQLIQAHPQRPEAYQRLIEEYTNRRQYPQAAEICRQAISRMPNASSFQELLANIIEPRGRFESVPSQPAGSPAEVDFIFRNARQAKLTAHRVDLDKLLRDIKQFYRTQAPNQPPSFGGRRDRHPPSIEHPYELFDRAKLDEYIAEQQAAWQLELQPLDNHWERRISLATPLQQPGLYVVTAELGKPDFVARCLVWIQDTVILRKQLHQKVLYFVGDASTGQPLPKANVEFFGFNHEYSELDRRPRLKVVNFAKQTDDDGQLILGEEELPSGYQWQVTARMQQGRLAILDWQHHWYAVSEEQRFHEMKAYGVTDRPAYRPGEKVQGKFWIGTATYGPIEATDSKGPSIAGRSYPLRLVDPQGTSIWQSTVETDRLGGADFALELPKELKLGLYRFEVQNGQIPTALVVRVEEYRKPEFEVFIDAPAEPVALGETFQAVVRAKYYFGAPVAEARAAVKVTRTNFQDRFYPVRPFDWCYGPGYGWLAYDAPWYPGWERWAGCLRPAPWWIPFRPEEPPELVLEQELTLDAQGQAELKIDTSLAKALQSDKDHRYRIEVEVRDASRRTIVHSGEVIAARQPFKIYSWNDHGHYLSGDKIIAHFEAKTLGGQPVKASGTLELFRITYDAERQPIEKLVQSWEAQTTEDGTFEQTLQAGRAGQYRLRLTLTDPKQRTVEGGGLLTIRGDGASASDFRFSALELIPDREQYAVGDTVRLQINADRDDALVLLFLRPQNGVYTKPRPITLEAKSAVVEIPITAADQPNFFVEAVTIYDGTCHQETREIFVPPQERVLEVALQSDKAEYLPGEEAEITIQVADAQGHGLESSAVLAVYDRALEQIASDALPPDIREFFWKWRRHHHPQSVENLSRTTWPFGIQQMPSPEPLGIFGRSMADDADSFADKSPRPGNLRRKGVMLGGMGGGMRAMNMMAEGMPMPMSAAAPAMAADAVATKQSATPAEGSANANPSPTIRKDFADAAYWKSDLRMDNSGKASARFRMPENLTSWQVVVWSMADGLRVGSGKLQAVTRKNLMVRLQAPRFLVDRDQVVLSALVNNDFPEAIDVEVNLQSLGDQLAFVEPGQLRQTLQIPAGGQRRVDWRCRAVQTGEARLVVSAVSSRESDAMELKLPISVHGSLRTESFAGSLRPDQAKSELTLTVPEARLPEQSKLTVRLSPSLAMAMVDALPFLVDYPHGCTEQTLNRFVPTMITQRTLQRLGIDLQDLQQRRNNLNAQELGDPQVRAQGWKGLDRNPVFDNDEVARMVEAGLRRLTEMQNSDGGWGWFSGYGEQSWPHTTAVVVRGLLVARQADAAFVPDCLSRGLEWLARYQSEQLTLLKNAKSEKRPFKSRPDELDALIFHILVKAGQPSAEMQAFLFDQRDTLSLHAKALIALAVHQLGDPLQTRMLRQNIEQFLEQDAENDTAFLRNSAPWWYWYGGTIEATALYLQLVTQLEPQGQLAPRLVKYLLNNRKHASYWHSTRDTAQVIEALSDYLAATGEGGQNVEAEVRWDGDAIGTVKFTPQQLFEVENTIELSGDRLTAGSHRLQIVRRGEGPLYWNVYHTNFTLEEEIAPAGLEIKVDRRYYRLEAVQRELLQSGDRGQVDQAVRKAWNRVPLTDLNELKSGQLVEVELLIDSKNDYEYLMLHDPKAATMEAVENQSGYVWEGNLGVYREFRDQYVGFFLRTLPRGNHSIRYRLRCEAPGRFTALPAIASGMYAPELVGNSADFDVIVVDD
jgi:uncharacterized protein YfaS (alpha-2-macroglobulin family)